MNFAVRLLALPLAAAVLLTSALPAQAPSATTAATPPAVQNDLNSIKNLFKKK